MKLKPLIQELIVKDLSQPTSTGKFIITWKDKMFIFDEKSDVDEIIRHLSHHPAFKDYSPYDEDSQAYELLSFAGNEMPADVVAGEYYDNTGTFRILGMEKADPITSDILRKMIKPLKIKHFTIIDPETDDEIKFGKEKHAKGLPKKGFHGTSSQELLNILTKGLIPGEGVGNFGHVDIYHEKEIFFATTFQAAKFYADNAIYEKEKFSRNKIPGAHPVVLELMIPDENKIVPDFDAEAVSKHEKHYYHPKKRPGDDSVEMKPLALSKEVGKFGYSGRIPPRFIKWVYIYREMDQKWLKYRPTSVKKNLDNRGDDWYYYIGVEG